MRSRILIAASVAAAALAATATPATAQQGRAPRAARVVATYDFGPTARGFTFPSAITIADSAGTLVASAKVKGSRTQVPMLVHVIESDLVLEAYMPDGVLTVVLDNQGSGEANTFTHGRWALGKAEGTLRPRRS